MRAPPIKKLVLWNPERLSRFDHVSHAVHVQPNIQQRGVIYPISVGAVYQALVGLNVIADLDIGRIPKVGMICKLLANFFHVVPIIVVIKFVAMSPDIKQPRRAFGVIGFFGEVKI